MFLREISILNYKNIREATLRFSDKLNCFVGLNGQGKTNILDAIYYLSFTKSAYNSIDSQNITHQEDLAMIQGRYMMDGAQEEEAEIISCGIKRGVKKQFRRGKKDYQRLIDHIGLIPLVMVSPQDSELISEGSDERRRFMDSVISQYDKQYLEYLTRYNTLLKQRNALLKQYEEHPMQAPAELFEVLELQMAELGIYIYQQRTDFINRFTPAFQEMYSAISGDNIKTGTLEQIARFMGKPVSYFYGEGNTATASGDGSTAVAGVGNSVNDSLLIDEIAAQRRLTEQALAQNGQLLNIIENLTKR